MVRLQASSFKPEPEALKRGLRASASQKVVGAGKLVPCSMFRGTWNASPSRLPPFRDFWCDGVFHGGNLGTCRVSGVCLAASRLRPRHSRVAYPHGEYAGKASRSASGICGLRRCENIVECARGAKAQSESSQPYRRTRARSQGRAKAYYRKVVYTEIQSLQNNLYNRVLLARPTSEPAVASVPSPDTRVRTRWVPTRSQLLVIRSPLRGAWPSALSPT